MKFTEPLLSPEEIAAIMSTFQDDLDDEDQGALSDNEQTPSASVESANVDVEE